MDVDRVATALIDACKLLIAAELRPIRERLDALEAEATPPTEAKAKRATRRTRRSKRHQQAVGGENERPD